MTPPPRWLAALALPAALALGACSTVGDLGATRAALEQVGWRDPDVSFRSAAGVDVVKVGLALRPGEGGAAEQAEEASSVVWTTFPFRFDRVRIEVRGPSGGSVAVYGYSDLEGSLGPRAPELDGRELAGEVVRAGLVVVVVLAAAGLLAGAGAVLAVVLALRSRRRRTPVAE